MDLPRGAGGRTSSVVTPGGKAVVRTVHADGAEMVEEYNVATRELVLRKWRLPQVTGPPRTEVEIGEVDATAGGSAGGGGGGLLSVSSSNPRWVALDAGDAWEWRVYNAPWPLDVFSLEVDETKQELVLRTSSKKFFKRWHIPAMRRAGRPLSAAQLQLDMRKLADDLLVIRCRKPADVAQAEIAAREEAVKRAQANGSAPGECAQQ